MLDLSQNAYREKYPKQNSHGTCKNDNFQVPALLFSVFIPSNLDATQTIQLLLNFTNPGNE